MTAAFQYDPNALLIVRHGQSTWNAQRRWQGQANPPLSEQGEQEATQAAAIITALRITTAAVGASDLERAIATATPIAAALGLRVHTDARLRERDAGAWQGLTHDEIRAQYPNWLETKRRPEGFEPDEAIYQRVTEGLTDLYSKGIRLVISHGGVMRLLARAYGVDDLIPRNLDGIQLSWPIPGPDGSPGAKLEVLRTLGEAEVGMEGVVTREDSERV